ncbi:cytochrome P450 [Myxococcus stipitatus]|uniref:cytochrome P450 n=1 Tax=Myxococcus stipitatus TaxID=83455 RepID=UPI001F4564A6|nr:cytochrome P450 [Myxococcus stipitatus]MCE9670504.1 cytochrome P450 [Myxococcus stipitatus]
MSDIPRDTRLDSTLALFRDGYRFIERGRSRHRSDIFETRLLLQRTLCLSGAEAARLFYDAQRFQRRGAAPRRLRKTLFGLGGVQDLDGEAHRSRKAMFMSLMSPQGLRRASELAEHHWRQAIQRWTRRERVVLFDEVEELLCRVACEWTGIPLPEAEVRLRTRQLAAMVDGSGGIGPRQWRARMARRRAEAWLASLVRHVRSGERAAPEGSALEAVAEYLGPEGRPLSPRVAAVELLNLLRPIVAVARFVVFEALALHEHPRGRAQLLDANDDDADERFVQEVRRFYPFFPFVAARVREGFTWKGYTFPRGRRVLLDLYGTNHDPRVWERPSDFQPDRFRHWDGSAFSFIPQGGGDPATGHRCPGERLTIALMKVSLRMLTRAMRYDVPAQDLRMRFNRFPPEPASRFVMSNVVSVLDEAERRIAGGGERTMLGGLTADTHAPGH